MKTKSFVFAALVLLLSALTTASATAATVELACKSEYNSEFHIVIDFGASTVTRTSVYNGETYSQTHDATITDQKVEWMFTDDRRAEITNSLSRDTGNMWTHTRATTETQNGVLDGTTHATCGKADKVF